MQDPVLQGLTPQSVEKENQRTATVLDVKFNVCKSRQVLCHIRIPWFHVPDHGIEDGE